MAGRGYILREAGTRIIREPGQGYSAGSGREDSLGGVEDGFRKQQS